MNKRHNQKSSSIGFNSPTRDVYGINMSYFCCTLSRTFLSASPLFASRQCSLPLSVGWRLISHPRPKPKAVVGEKFSWNESRHNKYYVWKLIFIHAILMIQHPSPPPPKSRVRTGWIVIRTAAPKGIKRIRGFCGDQGRR